MTEEYNPDPYDEKILLTILFDNIPIMKLSKIIGIAHNNLLHRLKRLEEFGYIERKKLDGKRDIIIKPVRKKLYDLMKRNNKYLDDKIIKDMLGDKNIHDIIKSQGSIKYKDLPEKYHILPFNFWIDFVYDDKYDIIIKLKK